MINFENKTIIIMSGFPGSGKSTLAKKIAKKFGFEYLSSDLIRQELYNSDRFDTRGQEYFNKITNQIYDELYNRAIKLAQANTQKGTIKKVIIDGTHIYTEKSNKAFKKIMAVIPAEKICIITLKTPKDVIKERMSSKDNFKDWQRVFTDITRDQKNGMISWPSSSLGIDIINGKDVYEKLA